MSNHYDTLRIPRDASPDEIKKAFIKLSKELHPDLNGENSKNKEEHQQVNHAYEILGDSTRRDEYNKSLSDLLPVITAAAKSKEKKSYKSWGRNGTKSGGKKYTSQGNQQFRYQSSEEQLQTRNGDWTESETKKRLKSLVLEKNHPDPG
ncbi:J domain-containing protein [Pedobacter sp. NJ-S-72]